MRLAVLAALLIGLGPAAGQAYKSPHCIEGDCKNGYGVWRMADDNRYEGEWLDGRYHGRGIRTRKNDRYEGGWRHGAHHGHGVETTASSRYEGGHRAGKRDGWGVYTSSALPDYTGQWREGKHHGWGRRSSRWTTYEGQFVGGRPEGWGIQSGPQGEVRVGQFRDGKLNGHGFWLTRQGDRVVSGFERGLPQGKGVRTRVNGDHYEGAYRANKRHGEGIEVLADGRVQSGRFEFGVFRGETERRKPDAPRPSLGGTAVGCLRGDCENGAGILVREDGRLFAGEWRDGRQHGVGIRSTVLGEDPTVLRWEKGRELGSVLELAEKEQPVAPRPRTELARRRPAPRPEAVRQEPQPRRRPEATRPAPAASPPLAGCTVGSCRDGQGAYRWENGTVYEGAFRAGRPHGLGTLRSADGTRYMGEWHEGRAHGRGTRTSSDGTVKDGYWRAGRFLGRAPAPVGRVASTPKPGKAAKLGDLSFGSYHALLISNSRYRDDRIDDLVTPRHDVDALASVLADRYAFSITRLDDATRADIVGSLGRLRRTLRPSDNLLIYYAGHGWLDRKTQEGYWLPVDAAPDDPANWLSNATLATSLRGIDASHVIVIADSCFSGTLTRGVRRSEAPEPHYLSQILALRSRVNLSSGGLEPVLDGGGGRHSVFAKALIGALSANRGVLDANSLFQRVRKDVMLGSRQTPTFGDIRHSGHEVGGDFFFVSDGSNGRRSRAAASD